MRKKRFLLILVLIFSVVFSFGVFAAEVEDIPDITIPEEITKYMPDGLSEISSENFSSFFTVNSAFETLGKIFSDVFPEAMSAFFMLLGLVIISAVIGALKDSVVSDSLSYVLSFVSILVLASASFMFIKILFENLSNFLEEVNSFMLVVIPSMSALMAAEGGIGSSLVFGTILAAVVSVLEIICTSVLFPMISALLLISVTSNVCGEVDISGFSKLLKNIITYILSAVMLVLTCVLTFQSIIAKSADTAAVKGVKFVLGNAIPIVGGALSDAVTTVAGSLGVVKSTTGVISAIVLCIMLVLPCVKLIVWKLMFSALSAISSAFSLKKDGTFFSDMGEIVGFIIAIVASIGVFFIVAITAVSFPGGGGK